MLRILVAFEHIMYMFIHYTLDNPYLIMLIDVSFAREFSPNKQDRLWFIEKIEAIFCSFLIFYDAKLRLHLEHSKFVWESFHILLLKYRFLFKTKFEV